MSEMVAQTVSDVKAVRLAAGMSYKNLTPNMIAAGLRIAIQERYTRDGDPYWGERRRVLPYTPGSVRWIRTLRGEAGEEFFAAVAAALNSED